MTWFLGLGLFIIGILFAAYVVTHLDQIWHIFENLFGNIEKWTAFIFPAYDGFEGQNIQQVHLRMQ